jgi:hypothetical protein
VDRWIQSPSPDNPSDSWTDLSIEWRRVRRALLITRSANELPAGLFAFAHHVLRERGAASWWSFVSGLSIPLFSAWQAEEAIGIPSTRRVAQRIVHRAVDDLIDQYDRVQTRLGASTADAPLVISGGLCNHNPRFRELLVTRLCDRHVVHGRIVSIDSREAMRPALGALLFAIAGSETERLRLPHSDVMRRLVIEQANWDVLAND